MALIESNILRIQEEKVTIQFQPSADQAWQHWAGNTLTQNATYPSAYANVHKSQLSQRGCTIGTDPSDTWTPPSLDSISRDLKKLEDFRKTLPSSLSCEKIHVKELAFMVENKIRQIGEPRIGIFAERIHPEPLHLEINNWQHILDLLYKEAVRRGKVDQFLSILRASPTAIQPGCGLNSVGKRIQEHFDSEVTRHKKLDVRLIGSQAISLAQYSYRLVDCFIDPHDLEAKKVKALALAKICQTL